MSVCPLRILCVVQTLEVVCDVAGESSVCVCVSTTEGRSTPSTECCSTGACAPSGCERTDHRYPPRVFLVGFFGLT